MKPKPKTWTPTKIPQLYRHSSGTFYARLKVGGKLTWRSLKTELQSVAKSELEKLLNEEATRSELHGNEQVNPRLTMGEAKAIRLREIDNDVAMKKATRHYCIIARSATIPMAATMAELSRATWRRRFSASA